MKFTKIISDFYEPYHKVTDNRYLGGIHLKDAFGRLKFPKEHLRRPTQLERPLNFSREFYLYRRFKWKIQLFFKPK